VIHQLVDNPPERIIFKSLEVLAKITIPVSGEKSSQSYPRALSSGSLSVLVPSSPSWMASEIDNEESDSSFPMNDSSVGFALDILDAQRRLLKSRDREVFRVLIQLHAHNLHLIARLSKVIAYMCRLQPPEFVFVSFAVELDRFVARESNIQGKTDASRIHMGRVYQFVSAFIQQMCLVLLNSKETYVLRSVLKDCIGVSNDAVERDQRRCRLFHILLHSFAHNLVATTSLCLWGGACRTASLFLKKIDPLDINLVFLLELDKVVEMVERPLFRHLHIRMLEIDADPLKEGSGTMLFETLKSILMITPQSACYSVLQDRLVSTSRFRQSVISNSSTDDETDVSKSTAVFISRVLKIRSMHCNIVWENIRAESLETIATSQISTEVRDTYEPTRESGSDRREWLGYSSKEEELAAQRKFRDDKNGNDRLQIEELNEGYEDLAAISGGDEGIPAVKLFDDSLSKTAESANIPASQDDQMKEDDNAAEPWKDFWSESTADIKSK
jgi:Vacuolar protein 14 C-terminal Fig4p binding